jgi:hypothetical protein
MSSLIYNNPYNNNISKSLINFTKLKEYNNQPDIFDYRGGALGDRYIGGAIVQNYSGSKYTEGVRLDEPQFFGKPSSGSKYIQPGVNGQYPQYNMIELRNINGDKKLEGGLNWGDVGNFFKPIISKGLDIAAPAIGSYLGGPLGAQVATTGRDILKQTTGYGRIKKVKALKVKVPKIPKAKKGKKAVAVEVEIKSGDIGNYSTTNESGGKLKKRGRKSKLSKLDSVSESISNLKINENEVKPLKTKKNRMEMVKKIMKEKGMNLPSASKYIKDNNLY